MAPSTVGGRPWVRLLLLTLSLCLPLLAHAQDSDSEEDSPPSLNITILCQADLSDDVTDWSATCGYVKLVSGSALRLACRVAEGYPVAAVEWLHPNGTVLGGGGGGGADTPGVAVETRNTSAALTVDNLALGDAGNYTCRAGAGTGAGAGELSAATLVEVYDMPTYFWESVIILSINAALVVLFLVCMARSVLANRKSLKDIATFSKKDYAMAKADDTKVKVGEKTKVKADETKVKADETKVMIDDTKVNVEETQVKADADV